MPIPNVTMRWCRKKAKCKWCEQDIDIAEPMVAVFYWNKGDDGRKWNRQFCYHPKCWVDQGMDYLNRNPYVHQARKATELSDEDRNKRNTLIKNFHSLNQRRNNIRVPYPDNILVEERLTKQMVNIMLELVTLGGVPKKWAEKLGGQ